ncbi:glutaredoxin family protein [Cyanobium sp. ATX 6E8]|uniref:glutaredoxin family protein n=1 Tax=Cyanobium sp. ATX 6E8 TaxID=2823701 RepID=UPI0020CF6490|nr:glutaredoxin family protein [Cyanobium sp. ATX 6E8]MCP9941643.1 glutaredoxin family protein [Cyanobium sp. ATX 6E8]
MPALVLMTRQGCCLCEGLAEKLRALEPPLAIELIDVDGDPALQARFGLEVPLLLLRSPNGEQVLPRVPPRLAGTSLRVWLQKHGFSDQDA